MSELEAANIALGAICILFGLVVIIGQVATWRQP